jgi:hypothetical protein
MNEKLLPSTVIVFVILYLLIFIVGACFGRTHGAYLTYDNVYEQYYERFDRGFRSFDEVFNYVHNLAVETYNYYDDDNRSLYSCPAYTVRLGGRCSSYCCLFMALLESQYGVTSTHLLVVTNVIGDAHAIVEYRGEWYDPTRGLYGERSHFFHSFAWIVAERLTYDQMAIRSSRYMDGVYIIAND